MGKALLAGTAGLALIFAAMGAKAGEQASTGAAPANLVDVTMIQGGANDNAMFGQLINAFQPKSPYGAPASARDFDGVEARLEQ
jgi:hypothetical protein